MTSERVAIDRVPVADEPSRRGVLRERFNDLLGGPVGGRMVGDGEVDDSPPLMCEEHENEEHAASNGLDREEVHRDQGGHVIGQERSPRVRRLVGPSTQEPRHRTLRHIDPKLP